MIALFQRLRYQTSVSCRKKHDLPKLPYDYDALQPIISKEIMEIHHQKHHQAYVTNLNASEELLADALKRNDTSKIIALSGALKFNGGGHINHSIYWQNLTPKKTEMTSELKNAICQDFSSFENFKKELINASVAVQGSGWGWLGYNKKICKLQLATCSNQDPLEATTGLVPLFGIDVWEHAYYLQYKNVRANYVEALFEIINWEDISQRFSNCNKSK